MKISFYNIGCKVNFADISEILEQFKNAGHEIVNFDEQSDIILINTCTVTQNADADSRKIIRRARRNFPNAFIIVIGCYAQLKLKELNEIEGIDAIFGTGEKYNILNKIHDFIHKNNTLSFVDNLDDIDFHGSYSIDNDTHTRVVLKIQDGCDYFCNYCTVPYARGHSRSMSFDEFKLRINKLMYSNISEVILSGINLGDYKTINKEYFIDIIKYLYTLEPEIRFRISSIEPNLLNNEIIDMVSKSNVFCKHFHIPLQSGSDRILKEMHRRYNTEYFTFLINKINNINKDICIGIDIITGFPGETDNDFEISYNFINSLPISYLHVFTYSDRDITLASKIKDKVSVTKKKERTKLLRELSEMKKDIFYNSQLNQIVSVIPETYIENKNLTYGWSSNYVRVAIEGYFKNNKPVNILLQNIQDDYVIGKIVTKDINF